MSHFEKIRRGSVLGTRFNGLKRLLFSCADFAKVPINVIDSDRGLIREQVWYEVGPAVEEDLDEFDITLDKCLERR